MVTTTVMTTHEEKMRTARFRVDDTPHIVVDPEKCKTCSVRACVYACPANLFVPLDDGSILFNYEQCFECGTCFLVCSKEGALQWAYPNGGYGVTFRES
jgi:ferredoxin like protein